MAKKRKSSTKSPKTTRKKKPTRYSQTKNVGLKKEFFSRIKQEYHDIDYCDKLSDKEKDWLSRFMQEDLGANFSHKGGKIYRSKRDRKACYDRNNARQRDIYGIAKATGKVIDIEYEPNTEEVDDTYESRLYDSLEQSEIIDQETYDAYRGKPTDGFNDE